MFFIFISLSWNQTFVIFCIGACSFDIVIWHCRLTSSSDIVIYHHHLTSSCDIVIWNWFLFMEPQYLSCSNSTWLDVIQIWDKMDKWRRKARRWSSDIIDSSQCYLTIDIILFFTGREWADWSQELHITGEELHWKFQSDGSVNGWGWRFTVYPIMPTAATLDMLSDRKLMSHPSIELVTCLLDFKLPFGNDRNIVPRLAAGLAACAQLSSLGNFNILNIVCLCLWTSPGTSHPSSSCLVCTSTCTKCVVQITELASRWVQSQPHCNSVPTGLSSISCSGNQHCFLTSPWCHYIFYEPIWDTLHTRMSCSQLLTYSHYMGAFQNFNSETCAPDTAWSLSHQHSLQDPLLPSLFSAFFIEKRRLCIRRVRLSVCLSVNQFSREPWDTPKFSALLHLYICWNQSKFGLFPTKRSG